MTASNRLIKNFSVTYMRVIFSILIGLYSTRIILEALGVEDFGLYSMIGGLVGTLAFLNSVMSTSTQRFISVSLGKNNLEETKKIFANSLTLHIIIGFVLLIFIEFVGMYLIKNKLVIPSIKLDDAIYLLHFVALSTFFTIISVPYDALITSHENMTFLAIINSFESILKLGVAFCILYIHINQLIIYGFLLMLIAILGVFAKRVYCRIHYGDCMIPIQNSFDRNLMKKLGSFAGWQLFGNLSAIARSQGTAVVFNLFFTTVVNAAYGIANQVNVQLMFFTQALLTSIRPQIMKAEGALDRDRMIRLSLFANKFAFYFFAIIAVPAYFLLPIFLNWWLKEVPEYTIGLCRAIIILTLVTQLSQGVITAVQAIGKIRVYQIVAGSILLLTLPIGYCFFELGYKPVTIIYVAIILELFVAIFRMIYFHHLTGFPIGKYFESVFLRIILSSIPSVFVGYCVSNYFGNDLFNMILTSMSTSITFLIFIYFVGLDKIERATVSSTVKNLTKRILSLKK